MRFLSSFFVIAVLCVACSSEDKLQESTADSTADGELGDSSPPTDTRSDLGATDSGAPVDSGGDSSIVDSRSDVASESGADTKVYPVVPTGYVVVEVNNGSSPSTNARAEFVSDRVGGGCYGTYADPSDACIVMYCPDGAVTHVSSGDVVVQSNHPDGTSTALTLTAGTDGVYPPKTLGSALWSDTDGFQWRVSGPGVPTVSYPYGGTGVVPLVSTITAPTVASLAAGIDRSADLSITIDKRQSRGPFVVRFRTAGATEGTGNRLTCKFVDTGLTKTIPSVALSTLAAGSYTMTISNEVGDDIGAAIPGGSWQIFEYIDTVLADTSGAAAKVTLDLK